MDRITHAVRRERWKAIVKECSESGMKKKDWLRIHGINSKTYYRWQRLLRMEIGTELVIAQNTSMTITEDKPDFCELTSPTIKKRKTDVTITTEQFNIEVNETISDEFLVRIMRAVSHV